MQKKIFLLFALAILLIPAGVQAQDEIVFERLYVDIWPEFDKPTALVIYNIILAPDTTLPTDLTFQIPVAAGEPNGYGYYTDTSQAPIQETEGYRYQVAGDFATVTFRVNALNVHFEYYDPSLVKEGSQRTFEYAWPGDYAVTELVIWVQQPIGANNLSTNPGASPTIQGSKGLMVHPVNIGAKAVGEIQQVSFAYEKSSDSLSIDGLSVEPTVPISTNTPGRVTIVDILPWGLGVLGLLLLVGGVWWYWQTGREGSQPVKRTRRRPTHQVRKQKPEDSSTEIYCHQCGKRSGGNDRFCRSCGSKLRAG